MSGGSAGVTLTGLDELAEKLGVAVEKLTAAAGAAVYSQGVAMIELIRRKGWAPVATGRLIASAYVTEPSRSGNAISVMAGYGAPYAGSRHENGRHHTRWLSKAVEVSARAMQIRLQESLGAALRNGFTAAQLQAQLQLPTTPHDPGPLAVFSDYQKKYGWSKEQRAVLRQWKKAGLREVRRWKLKRPAKPRVPWAVREKRRLAAKMRRFKRWTKR